MTPPLNAARPSRGNVQSAQAGWVNATRYNGASPHMASRASMPVAVASPGESESRRNDTEKEQSCF